MSYPKQTDLPAILAMALQLLEEQGSSALSLRAIASRLAIKAPSLYRYFADKAALEHALIVEGQKQMLTWLQRHTRDAAPEQAFRELAKAYLGFSRKRPALYFFMMEHRLPDADRSQAGKELWNFLLSHVGALSGDPDDTSGAVAAWAFLHGFAVLERSGRFGRSGPKQGFQRGLEALILRFQA